jgi:hypothetical protein
VSDAASNDPVQQALVDELKHDLDTVGLPPGLFALVLKNEEVFGLAPGVLLVPMTHIDALMVRGGLNPESLALALRESVEQLRSLGRTTLLAESLLCLARATRSYDGLEERLGSALEACAIFRDLGRKRRLGRAYLDVGDILKQGGSSYDALRAFELAAALALEHADHAASAAAHYHTAVVCRSLGLPAEALQHLRIADETLATGTVPAVWARRISSETVIDLIDLRRDDEALARLEAWIDDGETVYAPWLYRADLWARRSGVGSALADYVKAATRAAAEIADSVSERFRRADRARLDSVFNAALSAAVAAGRADVAFGVLELARSGTAMAARLGAGHRSDTLRAEADQELRAESTALAKQASEALGGQHPQSLTELGRRADWLVARADLLSRASGTTDIGAEDVATWSDRVRAALPADAVLLSYFAAERRLHVLAMTRDKLVLRPTDLADAEAMLIRIGFARERDARFPVDALDLAAARLLGPVQDLVDDALCVLVIPSESLSGLPFHAMCLDHAPLGAHRRVVYATRGDELLDAAGLAAAPLTPDATWIGLGVPAAEYAGLDELPSVRPELERAARSFARPATIVDPPARARDLLELDGRIDLLHVACHGDFDPRAPLLSRLMLADRPVFAFELMIAALDVDRVVLSACDTAAADAGRGGHVYSLAAAFVRAGAQGVVASLWPVEDAAAAACLDLLYRGLVAGGLSLAEALRDAQRTVAADETTAHPMSWAPFALFGAGEASV